MVTVYCVSIDGDVYLLVGRIRKEYEVIAEKALTTPTGTQQLMELKEFVEKAEEKDLVELEDKMALAWHRSVKKKVIVVCVLVLIT